MAKRRTRSSSRQRPRGLRALPAEALEALSPTQRRIAQAIEALARDPQAAAPATDTDRAVAEVASRISLRLDLVAHALETGTYLPRVYLFGRRADDTPWQHLRTAPCLAPQPQDLAGLTQLCSQLRDGPEAELSTLCVWTRPVAQALRVAFLFARRDAEPLQAYLVMRGRSIPLRLDEAALEEAARELLAPSEWAHARLQALRDGLGARAGTGPACESATLADAALVPAVEFARRWLEQVLSEVEGVLEDATRALFEQEQQAATELRRQATQHERVIRKLDKRFERLQMAHSGLAARVARENTELTELRKRLRNATATQAPGPGAAEPTLAQALARWF